MTIENIQKRNRSLIYFNTCLISTIFAIFITNIHGNKFLYIFLIILLVWINFSLYYNKVIKILLVAILWLTIWFIIVYLNNEKLLSNQKILSNYTNNYNNKVLIIWQILDNYGQWDRLNTYVLRINKINNKNISWIINILWTINNRIKLSKWDNIEFETKLNKIENFDSFEYEKYLLMKDIYAKTSIYNITKKWNSISYLLQIIESVRLSFLKVINDIYPSDSAKLLNWIFLWIKWDFSKDLKNDFNNSWLSHIVTVSWYNITIIIVFMSILLWFLPQKIKLFIITILISFFIIMIWSNSPALRAWITWLIWYMVISYGRKINIFSILLLVATIFIIYNPLIINYDIGFHLSFMALIWLITIEKSINNQLKFLPNLLKIRESISSTLSVIIFTIPIVLINFWKISVISIITNILVLPIIPINMLFWWLSIIWYYINTKLWIMIWYISYLSLKYVLFIVGFFWKLSIATINIDLTCYKEIFFVLYYFILIFIVLITKNKNNIT